MIIQYLNTIIAGVIMLRGIKNIQDEELLLERELEEEEDELLSD